MADFLWTVTLTASVKAESILFRLRAPCQINSALLYAAWRGVDFRSRIEAK
jgi:hypothetical protein